MISAEHTVVINRPVEDVFAFVADQTNEPKWHTDVLEVRPTAPLKLGGTLTWVIKFMGRNEYEMEVTGFEPHRHIELTTREGPLKPTVTHRFEPADGGTRYTRHVDMPLKGMIRIVGPIMVATGAARKRQVRFAENLKNLLEQ